MPAHPTIAGVPVPPPTVMGEQIVTRIWTTGQYQIGADRVPRQRRESGDAFGPVHPERLRTASAGAATIPFA